MYVMFLDESGDHSLDKIDSSYPMFVLAGCILILIIILKLLSQRRMNSKLNILGKQISSYDPMILENRKRISPA